MADGGFEVRATVKLDQNLLDRIKADAKQCRRPWTLHFVALAEEALANRNAVVKAVRP